MPVMNTGRGGGANNSQEQRQTFRPPWVKDTGPPALPMPSAPWIATKRNSMTPENQNPHQFEKPILKKVTPKSVETVPAANGQTEPTKPKLKPILKKQQQSIATEHSVPIQVEPSVTKAPAKGPVQQNTKPPPPPMSMPPPPPMSMPPPPPAPPIAPPSVDKTPLSDTQKKRIEQLKSRPRRRPDWSDMMKEVEQGKKLRHVQCNDRSAPIISVLKKNEKDEGQAQFVFESEKTDPNSSHNALLEEIQLGVKLKKVKTNDRSKPNLNGLRKFRRQTTMDEKIQKSMSMADVVAAAVEPDELDDIDKVRDDLQSAKQMLALELRNKETLERDNKKLLQKLAALEVELEKEKQARQQDAGTKIVKMKTDEDERLIQQLKQAALDSENAAKEMEDRYKASAEELDNTRRKLESAWLLNQELENQLKSVHQQAGNRIPIMKQPSRKLVMQDTIHGKSIEILSSDEDVSSDEEDSDSETEEESDAEDTEAKEEKRKQRELKLLTNKLKTYKEKHARAKKERKALREDERKQQHLLKQELKKYKLLQKEVDKMAKLMKDNEGDDEEDPEEEEEEVEEEESESSESEESSSESSDNEVPETATFDDRKVNLSNRSKKHETRLNTLKKGNYLLKTNVDRLQDDLIRQRDMSLQLQEDLNSVLAELG